MQDQVPTSHCSRSAPRRGFSLIELLVVIAIIAIAAAILFTVMHGAIKAVRAMTG